MWVWRNSNLKTQLWRRLLSGFCPRFRPLADQAQQRARWKKFHKIASLSASVIILPLPFTICYAVLLRDKNFEYLKIEAYFNVNINVHIWDGRNIYFLETRYNYKYVYENNWNSTHMNWKSYSGGLCTEITALQYMTLMPGRQPQLRDRSVCCLGRQEQL